MKHVKELLGSLATKFLALLVAIGLSGSAVGITLEVGAGKAYATVNDALAAVPANADAVTYKIYGAVTVQPFTSANPDGNGHGDFRLSPSGVIAVIEGADSGAVLTVIGGGVPEIIDVTLKDLTFKDEGTYNPSANEFMYQNFAGTCTFENVVFADSIRCGTSHIGTLANITIKGCTITADTNDEYGLWLDAGTFVIEDSTLTASGAGYGIIKGADNCTSSLSVKNSTFKKEASSTSTKPALSLGTDYAITLAGNTFVDCDTGIVSVKAGSCTINGQSYASATTLSNEAVITEGNVIKVTPVASIGETEYATLAEAVAAAASAEGVETIVLKKDVTLDAILNIKTSLKLDLNGKTITGASGVNGINIAAAGIAVEIMDTTQAPGCITHTDGNGTAVAVTSAADSTTTLTITGVAIKDEAGTNYSQPLSNAGAAKVVIDGATVVAAANGMSNTSSGTIEIKGATSVNGAKNCVRNTGAGTVTISGGTISCSGSGNSYGPVMNSGTVNVSGGIITGISWALKNNSGATATISDNAVVKQTSGNGSAIQNEGNLEITGGSIESAGSRGAYDGAINSISGAVTISGGTITSGTQVIINSANSSITITGGNFKSGGSTMFKNTANATADNLKVQGGYYSRDVTAYITTEYRCIDNPDATPDPAVYPKKVVISTYTVTFQKDDGTTQIATGSVEYGKTYDTVDALKTAVDAYVADAGDRIFKGWYVVENGTATDTAYDLATGVTANLVLQAKWGVAVATATIAGETTKFETLDAAVAYVKTSDATTATITLMSDTEMSAVDIAGKDVTFNLGLNTLTLKVNGNTSMFYFKGGANVTFTGSKDEQTGKMGTFDISGFVAKGEGIIGIGNSNDATTSGSNTLTFNGVKVYGRNYSSAYAVFYVYDSVHNVLNFNNSVVDLSDDLSKLGGLAKSNTSFESEVNISNSQINLKVTDASAFLRCKITIKDSTVGITDTSDANGFNLSRLTIDNSTVTVTGTETATGGRGLATGTEDVVIKNGSTLTISGMPQGDIVYGRVAGDGSISVEDTSTLSAATVGVMNSVAVNLDVASTATAPRFMVAETATTYTPYATFAEAVTAAAGAKAIMLFADVGDYALADGTLIVKKNDHAINVTAAAAGSMIETSVSGDTTTYTAGLPVAQIGTDKYITLKSAIDAASSGDTVKLLANVAYELTSANKIGVTIDKSITLDGDGHTITFIGTVQPVNNWDYGNDCYGIYVNSTADITTTIKNLKIVATGEERVERAIRFNGAAGGTVDNVTITTGACGIHVKGTGDVVIRNSTITTTPSNDNHCVAHKRAAVALGSSATVTLTDNTIVAQTQNLSGTSYNYWAKGVYVGSGTVGSLVVESGNTITADIALAIDGSQGATGAGANNKNHLVVNSGNTVIGTWASPSGYDFKLLDVKGGTFTGFSIETRPLPNNLTSSYVSITGGTYDSDVTAWCAAGYTCDLVGEGQYVVGPAVASITSDGATTYYTTFANAVEAAAGTKTITLLADVGDYVLANGDTLIVNANDKIINVKAVEGSMVEPSANGDIITYTAGVAVAKIGTTTYTTLQKAVDAAQATGVEVTINLISDISEPKVTVNQNAGLKLVIDGTSGADSKYKVDTTIEIDGLSKNTNGSTLTIQNVEFVEGDNAVKAKQFILGGANTAHSYSHNVTIQNCVFTGANDGHDINVFVGNSTCYNYTFREITVANCRLINFGNGVDKGQGEQALLIDKLTATEGIGAGIQLKTADNVIIKNSTVTSKYAFRDVADPWNGTITLENNVFSDGDLTDEVDEGVIVVRGPYSEAGRLNVVSGTYAGRITIYNKNGNQLPVGRLAISGGHFSVEVPQAYCAENYMPKANLWLNETAETPHGVIAAAAKIGTTYYETIADALSAVNNNETITMLTDVSLTASDGAVVMNNGKTFTFDLNGHSIQRLANSYYVLDIASGTSVTIADTSAAGTGLIKGTPVASGNTKNPASLVRVKGNLTLESGKLVSDYTCVKVDEDPGVGTFTMNGGTLEVIANDKGYTGLTFAVMNWATATINGGTVTGNIQSLSADANSASKTSTTTINGGTFAPATIYILAFDSTQKPTVKVKDSITNLSVADSSAASLNWKIADVVDADGYKVYTLEAAVASITAGGVTTRYATLQKALDAAITASKTANAPVTVTLLCDVPNGTGLATFANGRGEYPAASGANVVIDFNGKTYTVAGPAVGSAGTQNQALHFEAGATITLSNGTVKMTEDATALAGFDIFMQNYCALTIDGMTIDGTGIAVATYSDDKYKAYPEWYMTKKPQFNFNTAGSSVIRNSTIRIPGDIGVDDAAALTIEDDVTIYANKIDTKLSDARYFAATGTLTVENGAKISSFASASALAETQALGGPDSETGLYTVVASKAAVYHTDENSFVTRIGYETFAAAKAASAAGDVIKLLDSVADAYTLAADETLKIAKNTKTITVNAPTGQFVVETPSTEYNLDVTTYSLDGMAALIVETEQYYRTVAEALNAVQNGQTIKVCDVTRDELGTKMDFDREGDIAFTIIGNAPNYSMPIITFADKDGSGGKITVTITDATLKMAEIDARQNATVNVVDSTIVGDGGNPIVKSYFNGAINISGTSKVYTHQVTTTGYIIISGTAMLTATWQTSVLCNGLITVGPGTTFNTPALQLTGEAYKDRDNTNTDRVGKPAKVVVDGATFNVGVNCYSYSGADYNYNSSHGINIGTVEGKKAELEIKNSSVVVMEQKSGKGVDFGVGATVSVTGGSTLTASVRGTGSVTLTNKGTIALDSTTSVIAPSFVSDGGKITVDMASMTDSKLPLPIVTATGDTVPVPGTVEFANVGSAAYVAVVNKAAKTVNAIKLVPAVDFGTTQEVVQEIYEESGYSAAKVEVVLDYNPSASQAAAGSYAVKPQAIAYKADGTVAKATDLTNENLVLPSGGKIAVTLRVPEKIASNGDVVKVTHNFNNGTEVFDRTVANQQVTVEVTHFSTFTIEAAVAKIERAGEEAQYFTTLEAAITAAQSGDTVELISDAVVTNMLTIPDGVTLDGKGFKVTPSGTTYTDPRLANDSGYAANTSAHMLAVAKNAAVTIKNLTLSSTAEAYPRALLQVDDNSTVVLENVTLDHASTTIRGAEAVHVDGNANCTVKGNLNLNLGERSWGGIFFNNENDTLDLTQCTSLAIDDKRANKSQVMIMTYMSGSQVLGADAVGMVAVKSTANTEIGFEKAEANAKVGNATTVGTVYNYKATVGGAVTYYTTFSLAAAAAGTTGTVENFKDVAAADAYALTTGNTPLKVVEHGHKSNVTAPDGYELLSATAEGLTTYTLGAAVATITSGDPVVTRYFASLQSALDAVKTANTAEATVNLLADVALDLTKDGNVLGGSSTTKITINGNNHKLTFNQKERNARVNTAAELVLDGVKFTNTLDYTPSDNALLVPNHDIAFNCVATLNNVESDKALAFWKDASLKTVTVADAEDAYAVWIHTTASNVSIDGLTVNGTRGIKVEEAFAEQIGATPVATTTLSLKNSTFTTAKKSAVLVGSSNNTVIIDENNTISGVAKDSTNLVWVDEAHSTEFGLVKLNDKQEGIAPEPIDGGYAATFSANGTWIDGYYKTLAAAVDAVTSETPSTYKLTLLKNSDETFTVAKDLTITRNGKSAESVTAGTDYFRNTTAEAYVFFAGAVAQVGDNYFTTLEAANTASQAGDTITLLQDAKLADRIWVKSGVTIDGASHTIKADETSPNFNDERLITDSNYAASSSLTLINLAGNVTGVTIKNVTLDSNGVYPRALIGTGSGTTITLENVTLNHTSTTIRGADALALDGDCTIVGDFNVAMGERTWSAISFNEDGEKLNLTDCTSFSVTDDKRTGTQPVIIAYFPNGQVTGAENCGFVRVIGANVQTGYEPTTSAKVGNATTVGTVYNFKATVGEDVTYYTTFNLAATAAGTTGTVENFKNLDAADTYALTIEPANTPLKVVKNGHEPNLTYPEGYELLSTTADGVTTYTLGSAVATITSGDPEVTRYYASLQSAVDNAAGGETVVLIKDVTEAVVYNDEKSIAIDLNGNTWQSTSDVLATTKGTITINATNGGTMKTEGSECCAVWAKGGNVVINGGEFVSKDNKEATIYVSNADSVITINGGTFQNTAEGAYAYGASLKPLTLNVLNELTGATHIVLKGGTFYGNDPQLGDDNLKLSDVAGKFVADGYVAMPADGTTATQPGTYTVVEGGRVTFDVAGGTPEIAEQRIAKGGKVTKPADPTQADKVFAAWYNGETAWDFDAGIVGDVALTARWDDAVAQNVDTGVYFTTVQGAVNAAESGQTVKLLKNVEIQSTIAMKSGVTLNGDGHTISPGGNSFEPGLPYGSAIQLVTMNEGEPNAVLENVTLTSYSNQWEADVVTSHLIAVGGNGTVRNVTLRQFSTRTRGADAINTNGKATFEGTLKVSMGSGIWSAISLNKNSDANVVTFAEGANIVVEDDQRTKPQALVRTHGWTAPTVVGVENIGFVPVYGKAVGVYDELSGYESATSPKVGNATTAGTVYNYKATVGESAAYFTTFNLAATTAGTTGTVENFKAPADDDVYALTLDPANTPLKVIKNGFEPKLTVPTGYELLSTTAEGVTTYTLGTAVATITTDAGTRYYASVQSAVDNAADGETVVVIADGLTFPARVDVDAGTKAITVDLNGKTLKATSTAANGSIFNVKSGTLTIKNGTLDGTGVVEVESGSGVAKKDGICLVTVRSGATLNIPADTDDAKTTMVVDSRNGCCVYPFAGGAVNIAGGTFENRTTEAYQYKDGFEGLTVNQENVSDQLVTITGGTFIGNDPQLGDDKGARAVAAGYVAMPATGTTATQNGTYTVVEGGRVMFDVAGGTPEIAEQRIAKDEKVTKPTDPTYDYYAFNGWSNGTAAWNFDSDTVTSDVTLTANWLKDLSTATVTITTPADSIIYKGAQWKPDVMVVWSDGTTTDNPVADGNYEITYGDNFDAGVNAGTITITGKPANGYTGEKKVTFTIAKKPLTLAVKSLNIVYDGQEHELPSSITSSDVCDVDSASLVSLVSITWTDSSNAAVGDTVKNVGTYRGKTKLNTIALGALTKNYILGADESSVDIDVGTVIISKRPVTLTAENNSKIYGADDPTPLTAKAQEQGEDVGLVEGETLNYEVSRATGEDVGTYAITATPGNNPNYEVTAVQGTFTITPKAVTVTADAKTKVYGAADPELNATVTGLVGSDTVAYTLGRAEGENVGPYTITPVGATEQGNYSVAYETGTFTITGKPVTITAAGKEKTYDGQPLTEVGFTATALESGDTHTFTVVMSADSTITDVGTKDNVIATVDGTKVSAGAHTEVGNYIVTIVKGTLEVKPATLTIEWTNTELTYNGNEQAPTATVKGLVEGQTLTATVSGGQKNVGNSYEATATLPEGTKNYTLDAATAKATFAIKPLAAVLAWENTSFTYDGETHCPAASVGNALEGDTVTVTVTGATAAAGKHTASATALSNANYALPENVECEFTIGQLAMDLALTMDDWTVGNTPSEPKLTGVMEEAEVAYEYFQGETSLGSARPETAGDYSVKATVADTANYKGGTISDTFKVSAAIASITKGEPAATTYYASIAEAVAAAADGDTVKVEDNVTLDARVDVDKSVTIDLNGKKIARTGTSGNGSAFDVKSGNVKIANGTLDCTQDDAAIVADGVYAITARSGSTVTLTDLTVTVNSQAGACVYPFNGGKVVIESGTYSNTTTEPYQYKTGWTGMAVNQDNVATQLIEIKGGTFSKVNPALGDDSAAEGAMTFVAEGYISVEEGGAFAVYEAVTATFKNGDETLETVKIKKGTTPAYSGETPAKEATAQYTYTFSGWDPALTDINADTIYTAKFDETVNKYTVKFVNEDGAVLQSAEVEYGTVPAYTGATPEKAATAEYTYTFKAWDVEPVAVTGEATYTATYTETKNKYLVTFKNDDGSTITSAEVEYGATPTPPAATKAATAQYTYTFKAWEPAVVAVTGEATYTATYDATVNKYTIAFVVEGTTVQSGEVEYGQMPAFTGETPVKAATEQTTYTFTGWTPAIAAVTGNATYTAQFSEEGNVASVKIGDETSYYTSFADALAAAQAAEGATIALLDNVTLDAMFDVTKSMTIDLNGKKLARNDGNSVVQVANGATLMIDGTDEGSAVAGRINVGTANDDNGNVVLNGGAYSCAAGNTVLHVNGTCTDSDVTIMNATIVSPSDNGIQLNGAGTHTIKNSTIQGKTAVYVKAGEVTITGSTLESTAAEHSDYNYNGNGSNPTGDAIVVDSCAYPGGNPSVALGEGTTLKVDEDSGNAQVGYYEANTEKEGYESGVVEALSSELTVPEGYTWVKTDTEGVYTLTKQFTVTFADDKVTPPEAQKVADGSCATAPTAPEFTGWTFLGWFADEAETAFDFVNTAIKADITLTAKWEINQYTITFDTDGGTEITAITADYGSAVTAPADPTKTGYKFTGWDKTIPTTMPAEDMTVKAGWQIETYTITYRMNLGHVATITDTYTVEDTVTIRGLGSEDATDWEFLGWSVEDGNAWGVTGPIAASTAYTGKTGDIVLTAKALLKLKDAHVQVADATYNGAAQTPATVVVDGKTLVEGTDYTVVYADNTAAGTATVTVTAKEGSDYSGTATATFTIKPAPVKVTATDVTIVQGEAIPALTATTEGTFNNDTVAYEVGTTATATSRVGEYPITVSGEAAQGNYAVTFVAGTLTIGRATVQNTSTQKTYATIADAVAEATAGDTLKFIQANRSYTEGGVTFDRALTLDLNGNDWFVDEGCAATADLTITNGEIEGDYDVQVLTVSAGTTTLTGVIVQGYNNDFDAAGSQAVVAATGAGKVVIDNAEIGTADALALVADGEGASIEIKGDSTAIYNAATPAEGETSTGLLTVANGGTITVYGGWFSEKVADDFAAEGLKPTEALTVEQGAIDANTPYTVARDIALVTVETAEAVYSGEQQKPALTVTDGEGEDAVTLVEGTDFTVAWGENVAAGETTGTVTLTGTGKNYAGTKEVTFAIKQAEITITVTGIDAESVTYDGTAQTANVAYTAESDSTLFEADKVGYTGAATVSGTNAGDYAYGLTAEQFSYDDTNIKATFRVTDAKFTIAKAAIEIAVAGTASSKVYNGGEQTVEVAWTATSESKLFDPTKVTREASTVSGTTVGSYAYGLAAEQFGYSDENITATFTVTDAALAIAQAEIAVTVAGTAAEKVYNGTEQTVEVAWTAASGSTLFDPAKVTREATTVSGTTVGSYAYGLAVEQFSYSDANIIATFTVTDAALAITKASLTAKAVDKTGVRGNTVKYTVTYEGFVNGETKAVLTTEATATSTYDPADLEDTTASYPITASGADAANYDITYVPGTLTISDALVEYTAGNGKVTYYDAIPSAFSSSGTYKLLGDVTRTLRMTPGILAGDVTLDLNGHTLTSTAADYAILLSRAGSEASHKTFAIVDTSAEKGGKLVVNPAAKSAIQAQGKYNDITIGEGVTIDGGCVALTSENQTLNVNGAINGGNDFAIATNGSSTKNATININDGAKLTSSVTAVYLPGTGTTTISGGEITGATAVYVKSGTLNVTGGTLKGTGSAAGYTYNGSGAIATGDALVVDNCGYPGGEPEVSITGGTFISANAQAVGSYVKDDSFTALEGFIDPEGTALFSDADSDGVPEGYWLVESETEGLYEVKKFYVVTFLDSDGDEMKKVELTVDTTAEAVTGEAPAITLPAGATGYSWTPTIEAVSSNATYTVSYVFGNGFVYPVGNGGVLIDADWIKSNANNLDVSGVQPGSQAYTDAVDVLSKPVAGGNVPLWQCYVLGLDPKQTQKLVIDSAAVDGSNYAILGAFTPKKKQGDTWTLKTGKENAVDGYTVNANYRLVKKVAGKWEYASDEKIPVTTGENGTAPLFTVGMDGVAFQTLAIVIDVTVDAVTPAQGDDNP